MDALLPDPLLEAHDLAQGHAALVAADRQGPQLARPGALVEGQAQADEDVLGFVHPMEQAGIGAGLGDAQGLRHLVGVDTQQGGLFLVEAEAHLGLVRLHVPVHVHHPGGGFEAVADMGGDADLFPVVRPIDLRDQGLEHRWPRRDLGDLDAGTMLPGDVLDALTDALGDGMALQFPLLAMDQVDLDVGDVGTPAQEIVPDQAVEVIGGGGASVDLVVEDLRFRAEPGGDLPGDVGGVLQGGALVHVDDDLELALVVEGQHLHLDRPGDDQGERAHQEQGDAGEKGDAQPGAADHGSHDPTIGAGRQVLTFMDLGPLAGMPAQHAVGRPRGDHEGDGHGEDHGRGGPHRDGAHVGAHQTLDEGHGQDGGDDGEGGEDQGAADLVDRLHRQLLEGPVAVLGQAEVAHHVLHVDDGVVHQDADGEDEGEEGDAVEGEAEQIEGRQGQGQGHRDGNGHHPGLSPAQDQGDQQADAGHRQAHVEQQLVGLLPGRLAVVAGHGHLDVRRDDPAAQGLDLAQHLGDHLHGVGPGALGHRQGHRRRLLQRRASPRGVNASRASASLISAGWAGAGAGQASASRANTHRVRAAEEDIVLDLFRPVLDAGDVA